MKANRAYELLVTRGGLGPALIASPERTDRIELVSIDDGEVVLFWELDARTASRRTRELRRDMARLEANQFFERWRGRGARES